MYLPLASSVNTEHDSNWNAVPKLGCHERLDIYAGWPANIAQPHTNGRVLSIYFACLDIFRKLDDVKSLKTGAYGSVERKSRVTTLEILIEVSLLIFEIQSMSGKFAMICCDTMQEKSSCAF